MSPVRQTAIVVALAIIGPVMYVFSRAHSLTLAFERINLGDSRTRVMSVMGKPQNDPTGGGGATEFRYWAWPLPQVWVIRFNDSKVVAKEGATP